MASLRSGSSSVLWRLSARGLWRSLDEDGSKYLTNQVDN